jgi:cell division protein FtsI (penicillin-binding protein 3)
MSEPADMQAFLRKLRLMDTVPIETGDAVGHPLYTPLGRQDLWRTTVGYGYGIAVTPLQAAAAASSLVNGGTLFAPTLLLRAGQQPPAGRRVISERTSADLRQLLRNAVLRGTGAQADVPGYGVGGKTGTSSRFVAGHYTNDRWFSWFVCAFPLQAVTPRYTLLVMLDVASPEQGAGNAGESAGRAGASEARWAAVPVAGQIIRKIGPLLGAGARIG